jgi:hypothetical protein
VKASNTDTGDQFGASLAVKGDTLIVGASGEASCATGVNGNQADNGCPRAGAVYTFTQANNLWSQFAYLKPIPPSLQSFAGAFATNLAFDGTTLAVGAADNNCARGFNPSPGSNDCPFAGSVYLFTPTATSWTQRAYVKATNTDAFDFFGSGLGIVGNTLAVGATSEDSCATGINGNQKDNACGPVPNPDPAINHLTTGSGAVYVYVLQ